LDRLSAAASGKKKKKIGKENKEKNWKTYKIGTDVTRGSETPLLKINKY